MKEEPKKPSKDLLRGDLERNFYEGMKERYQRLEKTPVFEIIKSALGQRIDNIYARLKEVEAGILKEEDKEKLIGDMKAIFDLLDFLIIDWNQQTKDLIVEKRNKIFGEAKKEIDNLIKDTSKISPAEYSRLLLLRSIQNLIKFLIKIRTERKREEVKIFEEYFTNQLEGVKNLDNMGQIHQLISRVSNFLAYLEIVLEKKPQRS
jgi:hypothetical protein